LPKTAETIAFRNRLNNPELSARRSNHIIDVAFGAADGSRNSGGVHSMCSEPKDLCLILIAVGVDPAHRNSNVLAAEFAAKAPGPVHSDCD